jgi:hypothetical protein
MAMDINLNGLYGHALTVIGRALIEIGEIEKRQELEVHGQLPLVFAPSAPQEPEQPQAQEAPAEALSLIHI